MKYLVKVGTGNLSTTEAEKRVIKTKEFFKEIKFFEYTDKVAYVAIPETTNFDIVVVQS